MRWTWYVDLLVRSTYHVHLMLGYNNPLAWLHLRFFTDPKAVLLDSLATLQCTQVCSIAFTWMGINFTQLGSHWLPPDPPTLKKKDLEHVLNPKCDCQAVVYPTDHTKADELLVLQNTINHSSPNDGWKWCPQESSIWRTEVQFSHIRYYRGLFNVPIRHSSLCINK